MTSNFSEKITKVYTALINRINASISTHNSSNSAHNDIRESIPEDTSDITEDSSLGQLGTNANATQHDINLAINNLIGNASGDTNSIVDYYYDSTTEEIILEYDNGKLITSVGKTSSGNVDTYTIYFNDNTNYQFTVTNGGSGSSVSIQTSWGSTTSDSKVPSEKLVKTSLDSKADTSSIPTKISDLTNDSDFVETSSTVGLLKNDGTVDTNTYLTSHQSLSNYYTKSEIDSLIGDIEEDMLS